MRSRPGHLFLLNLLPISYPSVLLVLVKNRKSGVLHEGLVELLEFLERVLVVLTSALRQDIHAEVSVCNLLLVVFLIL